MKVMLTIVCAALFSVATQAAGVQGNAETSEIKSRVPAPQPVSSGYYVACHYFPGWGVKKNGYSMFKDVLDFPDRMPLIGCYDEGDPEVADWQVKWAREHGINCFVFCWYRSKSNVGKPVTTADLLLAHQLPAFEKAAYGRLIDFAIMWECDNAGGATDAKDLAENLVPFWVENYFRKPNYLKLGNRPVVFVYDNSFKLMKQVGGPEKLRAAFAAASAKARTYGFDGLHFMAENRNRSREQLDKLKAAGYEQTFAYCWHARPGSPTQEEAMKVQLDGNRMHVAYDPAFTILTASQAWDPYPWWRRWYPERVKELSRWKLTPENWRKVLEEIRKMADEMPSDAVGHRLIMLDNWNEWCEGHYIAPHRSGGFKYLQAVREVFTKRDNLPDYRLPHDLGLGPYDKGIDWAAPEVKWDEP